MATPNLGNDHSPNPQFNSQFIALANKYKPSYASYLGSECVDLIKHATVGAVATAVVSASALIKVSAGTLASKVFVPLSLQQGVIVGGVTGAVISLVQKIIFTAVNQKETTRKSFFIAAATFAAIFFGVTTYPALTTSLLGRVGLDLSKDAIMKLFTVNLIGNVAFAAFKEIKTTQKMKNIFNNFDESFALIIHHFEANNLYSKLNLKTVDQVEKAPNHVIIHFYQKFYDLLLLFTKREINIDVLKAFHQRVNNLKLKVVPNHPEEVKDLTKHELSYILANYTYLTHNMHRNIKTLLNARIEAELVEKPTNQETVNNMNLFKLAYICANYTPFTKKMKKDVVTFLENKIKADLLENIDLVKKPTFFKKRRDDSTLSFKANKLQIHFAINNFVEFTHGMSQEEIQTIAINIGSEVPTVAKPTSANDVQSLSDPQILFLYSSHNNYAFFKKNLYPDRDTIIALNARYKALGLKEKKVPPLDVAIYSKSNSSSSTAVEEKQVSNSTSWSDWFWEQFKKNKA